MKKQYIAILIISLVLFANGGCKEGAHYQSIEGSVPTITVAGQGTVTATPDEATLMFGVVSEERELSKAYAKNTSDMNLLIKTIKGMSIEDNNIRTSSYTITPVYPVDERGRRLPGKPVSFRVSQQLTVLVKNISKIGNLIDTAIESGSNMFNGIQFGLSDIEGLEKQAKIAAVKDAEAKATLLATNLRVKLGRILKVDESTMQPYPARNRMAFESLSAAAPPQIEAGSMEVSATCTIIYEIIQ